MCFAVIFSWLWSNSCLLFVICWQLVAAEKATANSLSEHAAAEKLPLSADQTRSTRDILHLIQSRVTDDSQTPVSSNTTGTGSSETVTSGRRQFQIRPQLFEAIMMQPTSTVSDAENNSESAEAKQSPAGLYLLMYIVPALTDFFVVMHNTVRRHSTNCTMLFRWNSAHSFVCLSITLTVCVKTAKHWHIVSHLEVTLYYFSHSRCCLRIQVVNEKFVIFDQYLAKSQNTAAVKQ